MGAVPKQSLTEAETKQTESQETILPNQRNYSGLTWVLWVPDIAESRLGDERVERASVEKLTLKEHCYCLVTQLCLTLCDPMDCSPTGSSVHRILQARILEWVAIPFSRGIFLTQGWSLGLLHWQADSSPLSYQGSLSRLVAAC